MKKYFLLFAMLTTVSLSHAQEEVEGISIEGHFLGVQANELLRQVLSIGSSSLPTNPYFFNYTYTAASGDGFSSSIAYSREEFDNSDNFTSLETESDRFAIRLGYEKKKVLSKRFIYSLGVDFLIESQKNVTTSEDNFSNGQAVIITNKRSGWGLGPRFNFYYRLSDRILIGTEANYYYKSLKDKFSTEFDDDFGIDDEEDERSINSFTFASR